MSFSASLHAPSLPYYTGDVAAVDNPPTVVGLAGVNYPIDLAKYRHNGLASFRDGVTTSGEPSDQLFDSQGAWWRYRLSWHHGAGQRVLDLDDSADAARFYASRGIDPWTKYQACLLPSTSLVRSSAIDGIVIATTATHVYVRDAAQQVVRSADLSSWTAITGMAAEDVVAMTSDGTSCYIATTGHIYRVDVGGVGATSVTTGVPTTAFSNVSFVGNRLLAGDGNKLVDIQAATLDTVYTHFQAAFRWTTLFQVGSRIYVGGYAGNRSELFTTTTTDVGALVLAAEAASFFAGELINTALSYGGSVIIGTSKGIRFATLGADATLQYGPLIDAPGDVTAIAAEGRFAWFGWESFPDSGAGLGRVALDTFVDTLQPAYASDIFTEASSNDVVAIARFSNRTLFAVAGVGVYASATAAYVTTGYVDVGEIYFGTVEDKSITEMRVRTDLLATGESVALEIFDAETSTSLASATADVVDDVGIAVNAEGEIVNRLSARITLAGPGTSHPCMRQWRARAYPIAPSVEEWLVPLIISSRVIVGDGQGQVLSFDPWAEIERIKEKWASKQVVVYQEGIHAMRVRIDNFQVDTINWRDGSDWFEIVLNVRLLSV